MLVALSRRRKQKQQQRDDDKRNEFRHVNHYVDVDARADKDSY
jgi:hypothetical protein